jgi:hypothetical protein
MASARKHQCNRAKRKLFGTAPAHVLAQLDTKAMLLLGCCLCASITPPCPSPAVGAFLLMCLRNLP